MRDDNLVGTLNHILIMICIDMNLQLDRGSRVIMSIILNRSTGLPRAFEVLQLFEVVSLVSLPSQVKSALSSPCFGTVSITFPRNMK